LLFHNIIVFTQYYYFFVSILIKKILVLVSIYSILYI